MDISTNSISFYRFNNEAFKEPKAVWFNFGVQKILANFNKRIKSRVSDFGYSFFGKIVLI